MAGTFNIRVYGILINERQEVLLADEYRFGMQFTKFPGGGLEQGEGTIDCLKRECMEELGQKVEAGEHFYTTDYYQPSAFNPNEQLISIYYFIRTAEPLRINVTYRKFDFQELKEGTESFRWLPLNVIGKDEFTFPVDKLVAEMLRTKFEK